MCPGAISRELSAEDSINLSRAGWSHYIRGKNPLWNSQYSKCAVNINSQSYILLQIFGKNDKLSILLIFQLKL